jgi:putative membrane protein
MANWNKLAVAAGLAGALAVFGPAWAQSGPGAATEPGSAGTGTSKTTDQSAGAPRDSGKSMSDRNKPSTATGADAGTAGSSGSTDTATGTTRESDTAMGSSSHASAKSSGKVDKKLQEAIQKIHAANQAEVHMGQMGQQQASSPEVKEYAQKLEQDHQRADEQLTQAAQSAGIVLEGKGAQAKQKDAEKAMKKLQGKSGQEFDKEFVSMMVKDHEKDIKEVEKASKDAKKQHQDELASILDQAATGMKGHLEQAKQLKDTVGKGKSARGATTGSTSTGSSGSMGSSTSGSSTGSSGSMGGASGAGSSSDVGTPSSSGSQTHDAGSTSGSKTDTTKKSGSGQ